MEKDLNKSEFKNLKRNTNVSWPVLGDEKRREERKRKQIHIK